MSYISVHCSAGKFTGVNDDDINFFYGIPFAKPLTNKTQWQAPEKLILKYLMMQPKEGLVHLKQFIEILFN